MFAPSALRRVIFTAGLALGPTGCAHEALPPTVPGMVEIRPQLTEVDGDRPLLVRHGARHRTLGLSIPDGEPCLAWLSQRDVSFRSLGQRPGMVTPVAVTGAIGGVRYETAGHGSLVCDCRLAVALDWLGAELRSHGVSAVRHSGAYAYRTTHSGRPSLHAQGLAIDVHELSIGLNRLDVRRDYARGMNSGCSEDSPPLNKLACDLGRSQLLEEVITPDDDSDHRDHLHLAIAPL